jgi:DNA-binding response OmpR family regulator
VLRRGTVSPDAKARIAAGGLDIDITRMRVSRDGVGIELTATEFQLLVTMAREPGRVFTRGQLLNAVHGVMVEAYERAIDAHVKNIRRKLEPNAGREQYIQTVHGVGYRFADAD